MIQGPAAHSKLDKQFRISSSLLAIALMAGLTGPAFAQEVPEDAAAGEDASQGSEIVVTGSRIGRPVLDLPTPVYRHHRLLTGADGKRFAKRDKAQTLRDLRDHGVTPGDLRREMGFD